MSAASRAPERTSPDAGAMSVLVTGAAGFIGSHLCERLLEEGHRIWCLDNFDDFYEPDRKRKNLERALRQPFMHLVEGDVRDEILLDGLMTDVDFDVVVHLAARPGVAASIENPELTFDVNVTGTLRLLEAMRRHSVRVLLFGSSDAVYGDVAGASVSERSPADRPTSPLAASKRAGELLCHSHHRLYDLTVYCLRFFTVYGPRQRPDLAMHQFARLLANGEPIPLRGDGNSRRDYVYVDDVIDGIVLSLHRARRRNGTAAGYEIVNVGSSEAAQVGEMLNLLADAMDLSPALEPVGEQPGAVRFSQASLELSQELLGYRPKVSLQDGVTRFARWFLETRAAETNVSPSGDFKHERARS